MELDKIFPENYNEVTLGDKKKYLLGPFSLKAQKRVQKEFGLVLISPDADGLAKLAAGLAGDLNMFSFVVWQLLLSAHRMMILESWPEEDMKKYGNSGTMTEDEVDDLVTMDLQATLFVAIQMKVVDALPLPDEKKKETKTLIRKWIQESLSTLTTTGQLPSLSS